MELSDEECLAEKFNVVAKQMKKNHIYSKNSNKNLNYVLKPNLINSQYCIKKNLNFDNKFLNYEEVVGKTPFLQKKSMRDQETNKNKENVNTDITSKKRTAITMNSEMKRIPTFFKAKK